jgi:DNA-binding Lrp family transcriptional regulator
VPIDANSRFDSLSPVAPAPAEAARGIESAVGSAINEPMTTKPVKPRKRRAGTGLSDVDWAILDELTHDPHASTRVLAERLKLPLAQVASSVRSLDRRNVSHILAVLDLSAAGQSFCCMHLEVSGRSSEEVASEAAAIAEVMSVSLLSGGASDILLLVRFVDLSALRNLVYDRIVGISGVSRFSVSTVLDVPVFRSSYVIYSSDFAPMGIEENMRDLALNYDTAHMDDLDRCIVAELQQNARKSINSISRKYGINASTIRYRIKSLENRGLMRFITTLDPPAVGLYHFSVIEIQVSGNRLADVVATLGQKPWISQLFLCAGSAAIISIVATESPEAMTRIKNEELSVIDGVDGVQTSTMVKTFKFDNRWGQRFR